MPKAQPSTRSSFIQEYIANDYPNYSKGSAQTLYSVLNKAELYADKIGKPLLSFQKDEFIDMFIENGWFGARGTFTSARSKLFQYFQYQISQLVFVDENAQRALFDLQSVSLQDFGSHIDLIYYFKSEDDFLSHLAYIKNERYTQAKMICILYWYGFSRKDITTIEKAEVSPEKRMVRNAALSKDAFSYLYRLSNMDDIEYIDYGGRVQRLHYPNSKYLIRKSMQATKSIKDVDMVSAFSISEAVRDLSAALSERPDSKKIHATSLQTNKTFCDLYDYEQQNAIDITDTTYLKATDIPYVPHSEETSYRDFKSRYLQWRKFFYNA